MAQIAALVIKIPSNTVTKKQNQTLNVEINFTYVGPAQRITFTAVVTQDTWYGEFDEIGSTKKAVYLDMPASSTEGGWVFTLSGLPLAGVEPKTSAYGVKVKAEGTFGTVEAGNKSCLYVQASGVVPQLTASYSGGVCSFSFSGFQPNATVTLTITQTGGYLTATANSSGSGSGSFYDNDPAGTYTLKATDSYGHSATATFTIK